MLSQMKILKQGIFFYKLDKIPVKIWLIDAIYHKNYENISDETHNKPW